MTIPMQMAIRLRELPKLAEATWIHFRFMDRKTVTQVVCVSFCAYCTWCSGLDDIFQMCGLIGPISSSAKEDQAGCVSCTISFQGTDVCVWLRFCVLADILAGAQHRSNIQVVIWGQELLRKWVYLRSPGNRAERTTSHAQFSEVLFSPAFFTCRLNLTLIYFKLLNSLKALGNYFLKYTSCLNKAT